MARSQIRLYLIREFSIRSREPITNEIEKFNFLEKKYTSLIGQKEVIIVKTGNLVGSKEKSKDATVKRIEAERPYKLKDKWRVYKVLEFESNSLEKFTYSERTFLQEGEKQWIRIPRSIRPKKYYKHIELFSIFDADLEQLNEYKSKYPDDYVSPHSDKLKKSFISKK